MTELASLIDVPVLTSGVFHSHNAGELEITEDELDDIVQASNELQPVIRDAIETGVYRGNEDLRLSKPIPGLLNLNHQRTLPETFKEAVKGVTTYFKKAVIDGKNWIVQTFENVPDDIAATILNEFALRSVELLPLTNPDTGTHYNKAIRSTSFLDRLTPPAVPGQRRNFIVEFSADESPLIVLTCSNPKEAHTMPDKTQESTVDAAEFATMKAAFAELQSRVDTAEAEKTKAVELARKQEEELQKEREADRDKIAELEAMRDADEADKVLAELKAPHEIHGKYYHYSKAVLDLVTPHIAGVVELAAGEKPRDSIKKLVDGLAELAGKGAFLVELGTVGHKSYTREDEPEKSMSEQAAELMAANEGMTENEAFIEVMNRKYGRGK